MARVNYVKRFRGTSKTADGTLSCGKCGTTISKGDGYRWWANRRPGQRGQSTRRIRCMKPGCTPRPSETTGSPKQAALMAVGENAGDELGGLAAKHTDADDLIADVEATVSGAADGIREVADEYRESAEAIADGFGHETFQSEELKSQGDGLEDQANDLESWSPDPAEPDEEGEEAFEAWAQEIIDDARGAIDQAAEVPF